MNQPVFAQSLEMNIASNNRYVKHHFPNEKFISSISQLKIVNKFTKGLIIPENVKVAESRIPKNAIQRQILRKELRQAEVLSKYGCSVYLTPEPGQYRMRVMDAVVNGIPYEFRNISGKSRQIEQDFSDAKTKSSKANVFMYIESEISKKEVRRRIGMVLDRHSDYTGKIIVSFQGKNTYFWDTSSFRKKIPAIRQGS